MALIYPTALGSVHFVILVFAYIDPNSAGLLSQILTPLLITAAASLTFLRKRIGAALSGMTRVFRRRTDV